MSNSLRNYYSRTRHAIKGIAMRMLQRMAHRLGCQLLAPRGWSMDLTQQELSDAVASLGYHIVPDHFYGPVSSKEELGFLRCSEMRGIRLSEQDHLILYEEFRPYLTEFGARVEAGELPLDNGTFMAVDADIYYAIIRAHRPRQILEIGSGQSTKIAAAAISKNGMGDLTCIEPFPGDILKTIPMTLHSLPVQKMPLDVFEKLDRGDILFIDSTHVLRPGSDVWWEYCEILPRLRSGVIVHIHDIAWPQPYPPVYATYGWQWNEQYLLQAILAHNPRYRILWAGAWFAGHSGRPRMESLFPESYRSMDRKYPQSGPGSLWLEIADARAENIAT